MQLDWVGFESCSTVMADAGFACHLAHSTISSDACDIFLYAKFEL
jgi:hypothetical protein